MNQQVGIKYLHNAVLGLAVVLTLFCGRGDAKENLDVLAYNTTQLGNLLPSDAGSGEEPQVLAMQRPCGDEHKGFCVNGDCSYSSDLDSPICRCRHMYSGVRCEHMLLDTQRLSSPEEVIGISCGVVLILGILIGVLYCCFKTRCRKSSPPYKNCGSENSV